MTNEEILKLAKLKAVKNGWECFYEIMDREMIWEHQFAKAFWGKDFCGQTCLYDCWHLKDKIPIWDGHYQERWQYHLQQMVISEDPIKYLEQFI